MSNDAITYQSIKRECEDLVRDAIERVIKHSSPTDLDDLREKAMDLISQGIDGHEWCIYYGKAEEVYARVGSCDRAWRNEAEERARDCDQLTIGEGESIIDLYPRVVFHILEIGCNDAYEDVLETLIEESCKEWREAGKARANGFLPFNASRESAYEAEMNSRDFSPFEFTSHAINSLPWADEAWEAFDEGISEVFSVLPESEDEEESE